MFAFALLQSLLSVLMLTSKSPLLSSSLLFLQVRCWSGGYPKAWQNGDFTNGNWPVVLKWNKRATVNTVGSPWQKLVPGVKENSMGYCFKLCQCWRWSTCSSVVKDLWERCVIEKIVFQSVAISAIWTSIFRCLHCGNYVEYWCQIKKYGFLRGSNHIWNMMWMAAFWAHLSTVTVFLPLPLWWSSALQWLWCSWMPQPPLSQGIFSFRAREECSLLSNAAVACGWCSKPCHFDMTCKGSPV